MPSFAVGVFVLLLLRQRFAAAALAQLCSCSAMEVLMLRAVSCAADPTTATHSSKMLRTPARTQTTCRHHALLDCGSTVYEIHICVWLTIGGPQPVSNRVCHQSLADHSKYTITLHVTHALRTMTTAWGLKHT